MKFIHLERNNSVVNSLINLCTSNVRICAMLLSFIFSYWMLYVDPAINLDGIRYIKTADHLLQGDIQGAYSIYRWLFYPWLIASVSKLTGLGLESSAHLLTAFFSALLTYAFITLVRDLGGTRTTILIAAFVIVFHPEFNETRSSVLRDHGFWAFYLLAVLYFVRYCVHPCWRYALAWNLMIIIATLFRIEGIVFLILVPFVFLVYYDWSFLTKIKRFFQVYSLNIVSFIFLFVIAIYKKERFYAYQGRLLEPLSRLSKFMEELTVGINERIEIVQTMLLHSHSDEYAFMVVLSIPIIILFDKIIRAMTLLYIVTFGYWIFKRKNYFVKKSLSVIIWVSILNIIILVVFILPQSFLQSRFVYPLVLILLLMVPFVLSELYDKWKLSKATTSKYVCLFYILCVLLVINALEGLVSLPGCSDYYVKNAGIWLQDNIPSDARLYTNNMKIKYYRGAFNERPFGFRKNVTEKWLETIPVNQYDYFALWIKHKNYPDPQKISSVFGSNPIQEFRNKKNDVVLIYKSSVNINNDSKESME